MSNKPKPYLLPKPRTRTLPLVSKLAFAKPHAKPFLDKIGQRRFPLAFNVVSTPVEIQVMVKFIDLASYKPELQSLACRALLIRATFTTITTKTKARTLSSSAPLEKFTLHPLHLHILLFRRTQYSPQECPYDPRNRNLHHRPQRPPSAQNILSPLDAEEVPGDSKAVYSEASWGTHEGKDVDKCVFYRGFFVA